IEIRAAEARAADAVAGIAGTAQHDAPTDSWKIKGTGTLADFDPAVWASGAIEARWRKGPHRLSATGDFDLRVPGSAAARPLLDTLSALRGEARVALARSTLAGVPLQGEASWRNDDGAAATADLALEVGGNNVRLQGQVGLETESRGPAPSWSATLLPAPSRSAAGPGAARAIAVAMLPGASPGSAAHTDAPGPTHPARAGPKRSDAARSAGGTRTVPAI